MYNFVAPKTAALKVKVDFDDGTKIITITGFKPSGNFSEAVAVLDAVLSEIGGKSYDVLSIKKISVWNVAKGEWQEIIFTDADIAPIFDVYSVQGDVFSDADIAPVFEGYQVQGTTFTQADIDSIFSVDYQLSY